MAQFYNDFSQYITSLTDWTKRWTISDGNWTLVEDINASEGILLRHTKTTNVRDLLSWDISNFLETPDIEVLLKVKSDAMNLGFGQPHIWVRASGDLTNGYGVNINGHSTNDSYKGLYLRKYVNGTLTTINQYQFVPQDNVFYYIRFRCVGNQLKAKVWLETEEEPLSWTLETTDNSISQSGWVGIGGQHDSGVRDFDFIGIGTDGDTAPTSAPSSSYKSNGSYVVQLITLTGEYRIRWQENKPENTDIIIEYTTGQTQGQWEVVSNGEVIDINTNLWIKTILSTEDTSITPILEDLWLEEPDEPQDKILLTMDWWGRFNNAEGDLTVEYDATKGNLSGSGGAVESFIETFTPTELVPEPNPGIEESVIVAPASLEVSLLAIEYIDRFAEETDTITVAPATLEVELIHIDVINP